MKEPRAIERKSFEIVEELLAGLEFPPREKAIVKRVVHATGDPAYARLVEIHPAAVDAGLEAIRRGCRWFVDINMVKVGIARHLLDRFGGEVVCRVAEPGVAVMAGQLRLTRAATAMRLAGTELQGQVVVVGNAPTALAEVCSLAREENIKPALIIGTPVGFVGAAESKEEARSLGIPYMVTRGTRGGSAVAVAMANALLYLAVETE